MKASSLHHQTASNFYPHSTRTINNHHHHNNKSALPAFNLSTSRVMTSCVTTASRAVALQAKSTIANPIKLLKLNEKRTSSGGGDGVPGLTAGGWALKESRKGCRTIDYGYVMGERGLTYYGEEAADGIDGQII